MFTTEFQPFLGIIGSYLYRDEFDRSIAAMLERDARQRVDSARKSQLSQDTPSSMTSSMQSLLDQCHAVTEVRNRSKESHAAAAIILQTTRDSYDAYSSPALIPQIEELATTHYVVVHAIGDEMKPLKTLLQNIAKALHPHPIMTLIVRAHTQQDTLQLGENNFYTINDAQAEDFSCLSERATIILDGCTTVPLAKKIASIQPRSIFATTSYCNHSFYISCCNQHGYGMFSFDQTDDLKMNTVRLQRQGIEIKERAPCSASKAQIEIVKQEMIDHLFQAAHKGHRDAQNNVGSLYMSGHEVIPSRKEAISWYQKAADQAHPAAECNLGRAYWHGDILPQSYEKATSWYFQAAKQGFTLAQCYLAEAYRLGRGVLKSDEKAVIWYQKAAGRGEVSAYFHLGIHHLQGIGTPQSDVKAEEWLQKALQHGDQRAQRALELLLSKKFIALKVTEAE